MDDILTWLSKAWRWLSDDQNNRGVKTIGLVIGIFSAIGGAYKTIKMTGPRVRIIFSLLTNMFIVFWKRLQIASMISCTRMRLVILLGEPASLVKSLLKKQIKIASDSVEIARALAILGRSAEAIEMNLVGAAYGIAITDGPKKAMQLVEPFKKTSAAVLGPVIN